MVAQDCECAKCRWVVHSEMVKMNSTLNECYHDKNKHNREVSEIF